MGSNEAAPARVGIVNAGAWGTAIAKILGDKGILVHIGDGMDSVVDDINQNRTNSRYLFGVELPELITASGSIGEVAEGKEFLLLATHSLYLKDTASCIARLDTIGVQVCAAVKMSLPSLLVCLMP